MINTLLLVTHLALSAGTVDFQDSESLEQSLDRHAVARARLSAGLVESGELKAAAFDWGFADMPWVFSFANPFDNGSDDAKVNPFVVESD